MNSVNPEPPPGPPDVPSRADRRTAHEDMVRRAPQDRPARQSVADHRHAPAIRPPRPGSSVVSATDNIHGHVRQLPDRTATAGHSRHSPRTAGPPGDRRSRRTGRLVTLVGRARAVAGIDAVAVPGGLTLRRIAALFEPARHRQTPPLTGSLRRGHRTTPRARAAWPRVSSARTVG
jgi:hypothetical protein